MIELVQKTNIVYRTFQYIIILQKIFKKIKVRLLDSQLPQTPTCFSLLD